MSSLTEDALVTIPALFAECCRPEPFTGKNLRTYDLSHPFLEQGYLWATDGCILVRCPEPPVNLKLYVPRKDMALPDVVKAWSGYPKGKGRVAIPPDLKELEICPHCGELTMCSFKSISIGSLFFAEHYLARLYRHEVRWITPVAKTGQGRFTGSGFEGILMEMV